jgi:3-carboxy-cis,cis-muconate cycloisomerase
VPSHPVDFALFGDQFSTAAMRAVFDERATLQRWLDVEAALALEQAAMGLIPAAAGPAIAAAARVEHLDLDTIRRDLGRTAHPLVPVIRALEAAAGADGRWVHRGATTQDVLDTALVLQLREAHRLVRADLAALVSLLADLALRHRDTPMIGRTHAQPALPITFGFKVAAWLAETLRHVTRLDEAAPRLLVGQLGGAVGTLAGFGRQGEELQRRVLTRLGLAVPPIAWHAARDSITEFVALLAMVGGTLARIATEVIELSRAEIAELEEPFSAGKVGSSTMPHKRNPAHAERIVAIGRLLRALAGSALETMVTVHERDMSAGRAEWVLVPEACCLVSGALAWTLYVVRGLRVDPARMRANLDAVGALLASEAVMLALAARLGRHVAHDVVYEAAMAAQEGGGSFRDRLRADPRVAGALGAEELQGLLDPAGYVGLAGAFVDRVVAEAARVKAS